jgi:Diacylglycerol acyltransferase
MLTMSTPTLSKHHALQPSSIYPLTPPGSKVLLRVSGNDFTAYDQAVVIASSLFFVGGVFWVPALYAWLIRRFRKIPPSDKQRRIVYASLLLSLTALYACGPHRRPHFGRWIKVHHWSLWKSWMRFFAFEVVADNWETVKDIAHQPAILGISPHGIFPFGLAFAALTEASAQVFGSFRAVVATATQLLPWVRDVLRWVRAVDASRPSVERALHHKERIGLAPGGIAEISQTPSDTQEDAIIRKGIFRLALKYNVPIVPIYCFGSSMLLKRWNMPWMEKLGVMLRISLVVFFGKWGLPIPFRQRLVYVMGNPIYPSCQQQSVGGVKLDDAQVDDMYQRYCQELLRIFDRHKQSYAKGWENKNLSILSE